MIPMDSSQAAQAYLVEADDLLNQIEEVALEANSGRDDGEAVARLFRAFHTIKGSGAMFGFDAVAGFTHHVESMLDRVRSGTLPMSASLVDLILAARDHIKALLEHATLGTPLDGSRSEELVARCSALVGAPAATASAGDPTRHVAGAEVTCWRIRFRPPVDVARRGIDPVSLIDDLRRLGDCEVCANTDGVPALDQLNAENCHLAWDIVLHTDRGLNAIRDVFIFLEGECELAIEPLANAPAAASAARATPALPVAEAKSTTIAPIASGSTPPASSSGNTAAATRAKESSVRVPSHRLDRLVNMVGELVMNQSRLIQVARRIDDSDLNIPVEGLDRLIAELRDTVLGIRMMPIGSTFSRFRRLVHDLSAELNKEVELITEGGDTELDKTVLDRLGDPLVHLIRNCMDHGIEPPEERVRAGKPRNAIIRLSAVHTGSNVVVTIADDGRGLNVAAIRERAIERKLIAPDAAISVREAFNLILQPGFSTAKQVTSVSGRGVGMDVVKREIDALRGTLQFTSEAGKGTAISATLPLTLAIIDGLLVEIGRDQFIIPMSAVQENVELARESRQRNNGRNLVAVRGELVPYIPLRETFAMAGEEPAIEKVVIVRHGDDRVGLVVDRVLGSHQTVIQSLGRFYRNVEVLSGATIMGDGRVALILDLSGLIHFADRQSRTSVAAAA